MLSISYIDTSSNGREEITRADVLWFDILSLTGTIIEMKLSFWYFTVRGCLIPQGLGVPISSFPPSSYDGSWVSIYLFIKVRHREVEAAAAAAVDGLEIICIHMLPLILIMIMVLVLVVEMTR